MDNHSNTIRDNIRNLVGQFPELGENYTKLIIAYWRTYDGCEKVEDLVHAASAETIRRNYQKLVEIGALPVPKRKQVGMNKKTKL